MRRMVYTLFTKEQVYEIKKIIRETLAEIEKENAIHEEKVHKEAMTDRLKLAIERATAAHKGQVDKAGVDYIQHPLGVMKIVQEQLGGDEDAAIVAVLHDCIEDTTYNLEEIVADFGWVIGLDVLALSRLAASTDWPEVKETYHDYLAKVKLNHTARMVKIADIMHNGLEERLALLPKEEADKRRELGLKSLKFLQE